MYKQYTTSAEPRQLDEEIVVEFTRKALIVRHELAARRTMDADELKAFAARITKHYNLDWIKKIQAARKENSNA